VRRVEGRREHLRRSPVPEVVRGALPKVLDDDLDGHTSETKAQFGCEISEPRGLPVPPNGPSEHGPSDLCRQGDCRERADQSRETEASQTTRQRPEGADCAVLASKALSTWGTHITRQLGAGTTCASPRKPESVVISRGRFGNRWFCPPLSRAFTGSGRVRGKGGAGAGPSRPEHAGSGWEEVTPCRRGTGLRRGLVDRGLNRRHRQGGRDRTGDARAAAAR